METPKLVLINRGRVTISYHKNDANSLYTTMDGTSLKMVYGGNIRLLIGHGIGILAVEAQ